MLNVHDKIVLIHPMGAFKNVGEVCEVIDIVDDCISFQFGNGMHLGCMSIGEFAKYFEKYEPEKKAVTKQDIDAAMREADIECETVFDNCAVVTVKLKNGFVITESYVSADPSNFRKQRGLDICISRIRERLWELEDYRLHCELFKNS